MTASNPPYSYLSTTVLENLLSSSVYSFINV